MNKNIKNLVSNWILPILFAVIVVTIIKKFLFFTINVPSESMFPTIKIGDMLVVTRVYKPENLECGDLVVFNSNYDDDKLIKRLIGLPGDTVEIKKGFVYVNGEKLEESYVNEVSNKDGLTYKVPEGSFFFLGDNRNNSYDSSEWDDPYISGDEILGKAQFIYWPFNRISKVN